ncbi:superoxide dismutase family protein [Legionella sp. W05-934-2]|jgi:Cu-Zn family superoxide dismutase|uniref:superoxide dismutase family protein n=1 Tax=Legionella sp. W05-934-2 TaxID=1198649 RepID=UPI0034618D17
MFKQALIGIMLAGLCMQPLFASTKTITIYSATDAQQSLGTVTFKNSPFGVLIYPNLKGLPPGLHGFHLHEKPNCGKDGMDAGSHYDPNQTNTHLGPYDKGHLGDLPVLYVNENGEANIPTLAPRLSMDDLHDISLMIHQGGDNYSDEPPLGGGGKRIGCGVFNGKDS